eukprot:TRINITY_DN32925_c0_g1_i1.p1 TRINITY_DN32925_c0_g1~~TRINITY_DN32925_c0_g1_i1.p1  ORF type:complete len:318 (-),score=62.36 TRINITY_DN32925_c0_g1_i1:219-1172(-)
MEVIGATINPSVNASLSGRFRGISLSLVHPRKTLKLKVAGYTWQKLRLNKGFFSAKPRASPISRPLLVPASVDESSSVSADENYDKDKDELGKETEEIEQAWKQTVDSIKSHASKIQEIYTVYNEKARLALKELEEQVQLQRESFRVVLAKNTEEIIGAGNENVSKFLENPPNAVKDLAEAFGVHPNDLKKLSKIHDFCLGIPYGMLLFAGGFLSFMITGSIPAVRFGIILGSIHLALCNFSVQAWKRGESSNLYVKGQAAIPLIILFRELRVLFQRFTLFPSVFMAFTSFLLLLFYSYILFFQPKESENIKPEISE